jgi:hypothetical protein
MNDHTETAFLKAGINWANALTVGDTFRGSHGEAVHRGMDGSAAKAFSAGGHAKLQTLEIWCDRQNVITKLICK